LKNLIFKYDNNAKVLRFPLRVEESKFQIQKHFVDIKIIFTS